MLFWFFFSNSGLLADCLLRSMEKKPLKYSDLTVIQNAITDNYKSVANQNKFLKEVFVCESQQCSFYEDKKSAERFHRWCFFPTAKSDFYALFCCLFHHSAQWLSGTLQRTTLLNPLRLAWKHTGHFMLKQCLHLWQLQNMYRKMLVCLLSVFVAAYCCFCVLYCDYFCKTSKVFVCWSTCRLKVKEKK